MALATLSIDLVAQLASLQQGMDKAGRLAEKQATAIEARYARITAVAQAAGAAIGGALSVAGMAAFFRSTTDGLDALNDLRDATGSTIENISALEDIAARTGTSFETVAGGLVKFNKVLADAEPNSNMERTLRAIGVSAEELRKMDPSQALLKAATAIDAYADSGDKARLIQELFGKSTREFAPFLKDLAEAGELNATVTTKQAEEAEKFNKQLAAMSKNVTDAARSLVSELLPAINGLFEKLNSVPAQGRSFVSELISEIQSLRLSALVYDIEALTGQLARATPGSDSAKQLAVMLAAARREYEGLSRAAADANEKLKTSLPQTQFAGAGAGAGRGFINPPNVKIDVPRIAGSGKKTEVPKADKDRIDEATRSLAQYVDQLQRQIDKTEDLTERQKALDMLRSLGAKGEVPQVRELVLGLADELDLREKGLGFARAMTAEMQRQAAEQAGLDEDLNRFAGRLDAARKQSLTARREARISAGEVFSPEELERMANGIAGIKDQMAEMDEFTKQFSNSIQGALGDTLYNSLTGNFKNIGQAWLQMLLRMGTDALAADITRSLFPNVKGGGSSGGSSLGGLVSAFGGLFGGFGALFGGGRATGGGVRAGGLYNVAEQGRPELLQVGDKTMLLMGKQGGQVTPARASAGASGGAAMVVVHQTNHFAAGISRNEMAAQAQIIKAQAVAAVYEAARRGRSPLEA